MNPKLSVVIPAYNEAENIKKGVLDEVFSWLKNQSYPWEVLIVDDGSRDETVSLVREKIKNKKGFKLIQSPHGGKAVTVMTGMLKAQGEIVLFTDMDQATPLDQVEKFFPKFEEGFDVVIGSRHGRAGAPVLRKLAAWGFAFLRGLILGLPFADTQCGFKAFSQKAVKAIFPEMLEVWKVNQTKGAAVNAGFDVEALYLAKKKKLKVAEVEVEWHHVGTERVQLISDALEAVRDMLKIRLTAGKYKND